MMPSTSSRSTRRNRSRYLALALLLALAAPLVLGGQLALPAGQDPYQPVFQLDQSLSVPDPAGRLIGSAGYRLPGSAHQGPERWYLVDLTLQLELNQAAEPGARNAVIVSTNGYAAALIELTAIELAGQPAVRWSSYELFNGPVSGVVLANRLWLPFRNFLQVNGVQPGANLLTLELDRPIGLVVASAELVPGSGIRAGPLGQPSLRLDSRPQTVAVAFGRPVAIEYELVSTGFPAREVGLQLTSSSPAVVVQDPPERFWGWLAESKGAVHLLPLAPGRYQMRLQAADRAGSKAEVQIMVEVHVPN